MACHQCFSRRMCSQLPAPEGPGRDIQNLSSCYLLHLCHQLLTCWQCWHRPLLKHRQKYRRNAMVLSIVRTLFPIKEDGWKWRRWATLWRCLTLLFRDIMMWKTQRSRKRFLIFIFFFFMEGTNSSLPLPIRCLLQFYQYWHPYHKCRTRRSKGSSICLIYGSDLPRLNIL